jgi:hypothetical protein
LPFILLQMTNPAGFKRYRDWNIAVTERGQLALVPCKTKKGDLICTLLENSAAPLILRRVPQQDKDPYLERHVLGIFAEKQKLTRERKNKWIYQREVDGKIEWFQEFRSERNSQMYDGINWGVAEADCILGRLRIGDGVEDCTFVSNCCFEMGQKHLPYLDLKSHPRIFVLR